CNAKLGWIGGFRGFGFYARAHERRCVARQATSPRQAAEQVEICITTQPSEAEVRLKVPVHITTRQLKKRLWKELTPHVRPGRLKLLLFGRVLADEEVLPVSAKQPQALQCHCLPHAVRNMGTDDNHKQDVMFKVVLVGPSGAGKTSILRRFLGLEFSEKTSPTLGVDAETKKLVVDESLRVTLRLWDSQGRRRKGDDAEHDLEAALYNGAVAVLLCADVSDPSSCEELARFLDLMDRHCRQDVIKGVVANKVDLRQDVTEVTAANDFATQHSMRYFEVSARTNEGVDAMFHDLVGQLIDAHHPT
ncbi:rab-18, partial [Symbiodinium pilosum]